MIKAKAECTSANFIYAEMIFVAQKYFENVNQIVRLSSVCKRVYAGEEGVHAYVLVCVMTED